MTFYEVNGDVHTLSDLSKNAHIGIITGTFDPIHKGHLEIANNALREGCDLVLFYPHSRNKSKNPLSLQYRKKIIRGVLYGYSKMGLLILNEHRKMQWEKERGLDELRKSCIPLLQYLQESTPPTYVRVLGSDNLEGALGDQERFIHLINRRGADTSVLIPKGFIELPLPKLDLSSTSLTLNELECRLYESVSKIIQLYIPRSCKNI